MHSASNIVHSASKQSMSFLQNIFRKKTIEAAIATADHEAAHGDGLQKNLKVLDLTSLGIAALIGAGIFSTIGAASSQGGPAVVFLFLFTAFACGFSALCYAQFASAIPVSGSAYTYAYTTFGELVAWVVGWNLLWEYAIGNIAVAISWSDYFTGLLDGLGLHLPRWVTMDFGTASKAFVAGDTSADGYAAWLAAPEIGGLKMIFDLPALMVTLLFTALVFRGIKEAKNVSNGLVLFKLIVIFMVIAVGIFYIQPANWSPFAPNGVAGVLAGVSAVFYAYIGFDAISTTAEECENPQRDLPKAMFWSLLVCTILYVAVVLIMTGMVPYNLLAVGDPLAFVFEKVGLNFFAGVVALSAVVATSSVFLVFQLGQPRIWMSMSRDGLLPKKFAQIHPKFKTPGFSTIVTGLVVAIPSLFLNLSEVADLTSLGTLFAFAIVCAGVLRMDATGLTAQAKYKVPYFDSRIWLPVALAVTAGILYFSNPNIINDVLRPAEGQDWTSKIVFYAFLLVLAVTSVMAVAGRWSLFPVVGMLLNLFMMSQVTLLSWQRFMIWMVIGFAIYFGFGYWNSRLNKRQ